MFTKMVHWAAHLKRRLFDNILILLFSGNATVETVVVVDINIRKL